MKTEAVKQITERVWRLCLADGDLAWAPEQPGGDPFRSGVQYGSGG